MSAYFQQVTRFKCFHCGGEFKTQRHNCKFDPDKKNCLTCKHCEGQEHEPSDPFTGESPVPYFICAAGCDCGVCGLDVIQAKGWKMDCDKWEWLQPCIDGNQRERYGMHLGDVFGMKRAAELVKEIEAL